MLNRVEAAVPSGEFGEIEEEIRRFSGELDAALEKKRKECRLAREQALLRLSEMEAETLRQVEAEWQAREKELELLASCLEKEISSIRDEISGRISGDPVLKSLREEVFAALLGEKEP